MSKLHIIFKDGKPKGAVLPNQSDYNEYAQLEYHEDYDKAITNAMDILNPELIDHHKMMEFSIPARLDMKDRKPYEWPGTYYETNLFSGIGPFRTVRHGYKLILPYRCKSQDFELRGKVERAEDSEGRQQNILLKAEIIELRTERDKMKEQKQGLLLALHNQGESFKAENERLKSQLKIEIEANENLRKEHQQQQTLIHELTEAMQKYVHHLELFFGSPKVGQPPGLEGLKEAIAKSKEFQSKAKQP